MIYTQNTIFLPMTFGFESTRDKFARWVGLSKFWCWCLMLFISGFYALFLVNNNLTHKIALLIFVLLIIIIIIICRKRFKKNHRSVLLLILRCIVNISNYSRCSLVERLNFKLHSK